VGRFGIEEWLKPRGLVETLLISPRDSSLGKAVSKNASFARLRRIWETGWKFWAEIRGGLAETEAVGRVPMRLKITGTFKPTFDDASKLIPSHAYDLSVDATRISAVCTGEKELIVVENLVALARLLGASEQVLEAYSSATDYVLNALKDKNVLVEEPTGYGTSNGLIGSFAVDKILRIEVPYLPAISLVAEPRTFMILVPASRGLEVVRRIKTKYENEMGKVRDRLPVHLGLVFAGSKTPVPALLEAGRRMLKQPMLEERWTLHADAYPSGTDVVLTFANGITWKIPRVMGDCFTEDRWYSNLLLDGRPNKQPRAFRVQDRWVVHATELKKGQTVIVRPSRFDFEFLDAAARRFEITYTEDGRRRDLRYRPRPYYLEEIDDIERIWSLIAQELETSQINQIAGLVAEKKTTWGSNGDQRTFQTYVRDVLSNAAWKSEKPSQLEMICRSASTGQLNDILALHMQILKDKIDDQ
jgi:hypothetical protein